VTGREFFNYCLGSYIVALILSVGVGLMLNAHWRAMTGATLVLGLILLGITLKTEKEKGR